MNYPILMSEEANRFLPLLVVLLLAFLVPMALSRFRRLPVVVGEILAGILVGPAVLGWVTDAAILTFMSDIGLAFLMFLAGIEIDFSRLFPTGTGTGSGKRLAANPLVLASWVYLLTLVLAVLGGFLLNRFGISGNPWLLAFVLTATSLGVVLPILKERGLLNSHLGQLTFLSATVADFATVILLTIYIITFDRGFDLEILSLGLLFIAFLIFYRFGPSFVRAPRVRGFFEDLSSATVQIKVRGAIAILMAFVVLAEFVDAELILGAFLAGMIISLLKGPEDEDLVHKLEAFGFGFFIPVFFIMVGVDLELEVLFQTPESILFVPGLVLLALVVKTVPLLTLRRLFSWKELLGAGALLNTHLSLEIAVAVIGIRAGLLDQATSTSIILFAVLTVIIMPLVFSAILPAVPVVRKSYMLVVGVNDLGVRVAQELRAHGDEVQFLDNRPGRAEEARRAGFEVIEGPATWAGIEGLDLDPIESILALSEDEANNLAVSCQATAMGHRNVVAWVQDPTHLPDFQRLGVRPFTPAIHRITLIAMMARNPDAYTLLTSTSDDREITEMRLFNRSLTGTPLRNLQLSGDYLVLAIRRDGELLVPRGNTTLEYADRLTVVGHHEGLQDLKDWIEGRSRMAPTRASFRLAG